MGIRNEKAAKLQIHASYVFKGLISTVNNYYKYFHEHQKIIFRAQELTSSFSRRMVVAVVALLHSKTMDELLGLESSLQPGVVLAFLQDFITQIKKWRILHAEDHALIGELERGFAKVPQPDSHLNPNQDPKPIPNCYPRSRI